MTTPPTNDTCRTDEATHEADHASTAKITVPNSDHTKIAMLNDEFRFEIFEGKPTRNRYTITPGVHAILAEQGTVIDYLTARQELMTAIARFNRFERANDPHHEPDFGVFQFRDESLYWKIDYYDPTLCSGSEDPSDPEITTRVLTIMLSSEY